MIKLLQLTAFVGLFCFLSGTSFAARTVQLMYFNQPANTPKEVFMYEANGDVTGVKLPGYNFTPCYNIAPGEQVLRFLPQQLVVGAKFPKKAPFVKIPKKWQKVFILAFHDPSNPLMPIKFRAINGNSNRFGNGDTMFINFSPKIIYGMLGETRLIVEPGKVALKKNLSPSGEDYSVNLRQMNADKTGSYRFLTKEFRHYPDQRKMVFIYMPEGSKSARYFVTTIREYYASGGDAGGE
ncbi:MAG: hypothetical protein ACSHYA_07605 [Opitutaceae bacterium]